MTLPANREVVLDNIAGTALELQARFEPDNVPVLEMNVLRSPDKAETTRIMFFRDRGCRHAEYAGDPALRTKHDSLISLDVSHASCLPDVKVRPPETAPVFLKSDEPLDLRVFVDRSVVEVFVNGKQCVAVRVYPGREDSTGVSLLARGHDARLASLDAWQMKSIYG